MIQTKADYKKYIKCDAAANGRNSLKPRPFFDYEWRFIIALRKLELAENKNRNRNPINIAHRYFRKAIWSYYSVKTGITIYPNCFDKGLTIYHYGYIVVNDRVRGGSYVTLQCGVNISENVVIGNNVYIAPGAKLLKDVYVADNVLIGANAVVTKSITEKGTTWVGAPARKISDKGYFRDLSITDE